MFTWKQFATIRPDLAAVGRSLIYEHDVGLGFLATTRPDGGPRLHPICPIVTDDGLYGFIVPGPKREDLRCDGRYALHSETCPPPHHDDAFYVTGRAVFVEDPALRSALEQRLLAERHMEALWPGFEDEELVEFKIERCLVTLTEARDGVPAGHTTWSI
jgi:hypothetical protein